MEKLKTPFSHLVPPLSTESFEALKADIKANGVRDAVIITEDHEILDGHHRYKIDKNAPTRVVKGLTLAEKEAFVFRSNFARRNLSVEQKREALKLMKETAARLREEDARKWTQARVAAALGVARQTVDHWFNRDVTTTAPCSNSSNPDARLKFSKEVVEEAVERVESGESQAQVAADVGASQQWVSNQVKKADKEKDQEKAEKKAVAEIEKSLPPDDFGVIHGDFRKVADDYLEDDSVQLIFTDPPWDRETIPLYRDIAEIASRVLVKGGSLLAYTSALSLPEALENLTVPGMSYFWLCYDIRTSGSLAFMRKFGVYVTAIPVIWMVKGKVRKDSASIFNDGVFTAEPQKETHEWQQHVDAASHFIEPLTKKNGLVFDPFCGGGTTAFSSKLLGRKWLTCDVNKPAVIKARGRLQGE